MNRLSPRPVFNYHLKDHLGNVRIVLQPGGNTYGTVVQSNDYFPFGMAYTPAKTIKYDGIAIAFDSRHGIKESPTFSIVNPYKYNGKEEQPMPGKWLDYGARFYDAQLGRWHGVDPLAESYSSISPYHFSGNNPMRFLDLNGMNYGDYYKTDGTWLGSDGIDDDKAYVAESATKNSAGTNTFNNSKELSVSNSELIQLAATSYGEGSSANNEKEMSGISSVITRQADARGESISDLLSSTNSYAFAASDGNKRFSNLKDATATGRNESSGMKLALKGAINAVTGGTDHSNGAYFWDGADISTNYSNHAKIKSGFKITDSSHNPYNISTSSVSVTTNW